MNVCVCLCVVVCIFAVVCDVVVDVVVGGKSIDLHFSFVLLFLWLPSVAKTAIKLQTC